LPEPNLKAGRQAAQQFDRPVADVFVLLLYFMARWATQTDPQILRFLLTAGRLRAKYDPMKFTPIEI